MPRITTPYPFSDNFLPISSKYSSNYSKEKEEEQNLNKLLSTIDESPELYDPYSEINLFLCKKIKEESIFSGSKWTLPVQEKLVPKITSEFRMRFPHYRLGIGAIKRVWEKMVFYHQQLQGKRQAFLEDGKLNIYFLIRENLRNYTNIGVSVQLYPSHFAHQLAMKIGELIAVMDGEKPCLHTLAKLIWSAQRHLLVCQNLQEVKNPYDEYTEEDHVIITLLLNLSAQEVSPPQHQLEQILNRQIGPDRKNYLWSMQSDLIYRVIDFRDPLLNAVCTAYESLPSLPHAVFIENFCKTQAEDPFLNKRAWICYKYAWYHRFCSETESSYDRFLKWHEKSLSEKVEEKKIDARLKQIVRSSLPLFPFV